MPSATPLTINTLQRLQSPIQLVTEVKTSLVATIPINTTISDLHKILWENRRFVLEEQVSRKGSRGKKTWIRDHGILLTKLDSQGQASSSCWCCCRCDVKGRPKFFSAAASSSPADHLRRYVTFTARLRLDYSRPVP
ncbi:transposase-like protein [Colletotrichum truncatum]|uniref:Transposase-like protein n=1 Tax=Colletotrichum truncatum TaxID=5467 RepID=A0ACC3YDP3_COLTU|nr:transposase-like protein [Colletotrichum truncatum]KAF6782462.1 transposase-like protein [Colletotrichum truncatum]